MPLPLQSLDRNEPAADAGMDDAADDPGRIAAAVGRIFECSPAPVRALLLHTLLQPLGALSILGVANGTFGRIWLRQGWGPLHIGPGDLVDVNRVHVVALVEHVMQASPSAVHALPGMRSDAMRHAQSREATRCWTRLAALLRLQSQAAATAASPLERALPQRHAIARSQPPVLRNLY